MAKAIGRTIVNLSFAAQTIQLQTSQNPGGLKYRDGELRNDGWLTSEFRHTVWFSAYRLAIGGVARKRTMFPKDLAPRDLVAQSVKIGHQYRNTWACPCSKCIYRSIT